jgi:hypothetical protein
LKVDGLIEVLFLQVDLGELQVGPADLQRELTEVALVELPNLEQEVH